jgi:hypothetical protein
VPLSDVKIITLPGFRLRRHRIRLIGEPRGLAVRAIFNGQPVTIAVAHLNSRARPAERAMQMAAMIDGLPAQGRVIFGGDWNSTTARLGGPRDGLLLAARTIMRPWRLRYPAPYEPMFAHLARAGYALEGANCAGVPTFTFARALPPPLRPKLDWIAYRDMAPLPGSARVVAPRVALFGRRMSDHDFVICDFAPPA